MSGEHSIIPPSSAEIWGAPNGCRAWPTMAQAVPEVENGEEAVEGELAHAYALGLIAGLDVSLMDAGLDYDMRAGAKLLSEYALSVLCPNATFYVEKRVKAPSIHELSEGTPDIAGYIAKTNTIHILDYKYGFGVVEARENWQCINYAAGCMDTYGWPRDAAVVIHIIQPRAPHTGGEVRTWSLAPNEIADYFDALHDGAIECFAEDVATRTGAYCRNCQARHQCQAAFAAGVALYETGSATLPLDVSIDQLAQRYELTKRAEKHMKRMREAYEEHLTALLKKGQRAREYGLVATASRETWIDPAMAATAMGVSLEGPVQLLSPNQARKLGVDADLVAALSKRNPGLALERIDHNKAKDVFHE